MRTSGWMGLSAGVVLALIACAGGCDASSRCGPSFVAAAAARPMPDLATLAARCDPRRHDADAGEAFADLLKLRDFPDPRAVPALTAVLTAHADSLRIHGFAAAQALFCTATAEARIVLARHLLSPSYSAYFGIRYAFFHGMAPAQRDAFIATYHLQNLSRDLAVSLRASAGGESVVVIVTLENRSEREVCFPDRRPFTGGLLFFRSAAGGCMAAETNLLEFKSLPLTWIRLPPRGRHSWRIVLTRHTADRRLRCRLGLPADSALVLESRDMVFAVGRPGRFQLVAMFEETAGGGRLPPAPCGMRWLGRAVSPPLDLVLGE